MTIAELEPFQDKTVVLHLVDGEIATAEIVYVDSEYGEIIVNIIHTNRPEAYRVSLINCAFTIRPADVDSAQEISKG
jgi:hypothetical protein